MHRMSFIISGLLANSVSSRASSRRGGAVSTKGHHWINSPSHHLNRTTYVWILGYDVERIRATILMMILAARMTRMNTEPAQAPCGILAMPWLCQSAPIGRTISSVLGAAGGRYCIICWWQILFCVNLRRQTTLSKRYNLTRENKIKYSICCQTQSSLSSSSLCFDCISLVDACGWYRFCLLWKCYLSLRRLSPVFVA